MQPQSLKGPKTPGHIVYGLRRGFQLKASIWFNMRRTEPILCGFIAGTEPEYYIDENEYEQERLTASQMGVGRFS